MTAHTDRTRTLEARAETLRRSAIRRSKYGRAGLPSPVLPSLPVNGWALSAGGVQVR